MLEKQSSHLLVLILGVYWPQRLLEPHHEVFALPSLPEGEADVPEGNDTLDLLILECLLVFDIHEIALQVKRYQFLECLVNNSTLGYSPSMPEVVSEVIGPELVRFDKHVQFLLQRSHIFPKYQVLLVDIDDITF
jgi:hypothetical protein